MEQKKIVITGGNIGIGLETAKGLYAEGHFIIFGSRNQKRNNEAIEIITKSAPNSKGKVKSFKLDLSNRSSVEEFAKQVKGQFDHIDILINNAGLMMNDRQLNQLGVEMTMAINHYGHFLLTFLLFPLISKAKEGRIINVSSQLHKNYSQNSSQDIAGEQSWGSFSSYAKSKLANVQFTVGLADRLAKYPNIKTMSLHPGVVDSDFAGRAPCCSILAIFKVLCCCCYVDTETGARTSLFLATSDFKALKSGQFYNDDTTLGAMNELGRNKQHVEDLWRVSEKLFKIQFTV